MCFLASSLLNVNYPPQCSTFSVDLYEMTGDVLGKGANSSVTTCLHKISRREFAVKIVKKSSSLQREKVLKEVEILYMCKDNRCGVMSL